jgi:tRNA(Ile)-lysidine synthase
MLREFKSFVKEHQLFAPNEKILLAFSGGADSVCLLDLLLKTSLAVELAHVNFQLRGEESLADEEWVKQWAKTKGLPCHCIHFDTKKYADEKGLSIEEAARNLRYAWFLELMQQYGFAKLATAHHGDDQTETFLLNLVKGRGISGQTGILPKRDNLVRPLLFATKSQILTYCQQNQLAYRIDSSNLDTAYQRNYLRLKVIPLLKVLNPSLNDAIEKEIEYRRQASNLLEAQIREILQDAREGSTLSLTKLRPHPFGLLALYRYLENYQFNYSQCHDLWNAKLNSKRIFSSTYQAVLHQESVLVERLSTEEEGRVYPVFLGENLDPIPLHCEILKPSSRFKPSGDTVFLEGSLLQFPLQLRHWRKGDYFVPSGMKGKKKLSDYFTDQKLSPFEKKSIWLLCSGEEIIWVVGKRADERFLANETTKEVVKITLVTKM